MLMESTALTESGRVFQTVSPDTVKDRSLNFVFDLGMISISRVADRRA